MAKEDIIGGWTGRKEGRLGKEGREDGAVGEDCEDWEDDIGR